MRECVCVRVCVLYFCIRPFFYKKKRLVVLHFILPSKAINLSEPGEEPLLWMNVNSNIFVQQRQGDERGLLAIQFHPDFEDNNRFFLYVETQHYPAHQYDSSRTAPPALNNVPNSTVTEVLVASKLPSFLLFSFFLSFLPNVRSTLFVDVFFHSLVLSLLFFFFKKKNAYKNTQVLLHAQVHHRW